MPFVRRLTRPFALAVVLATMLATGGAAALATTSTPLPPTNVEVTHLGWAELVVGWEHPDGQVPTSYRVTNVTTGQVFTASASSTSSWVRPLEPEQTYELDVQAVVQLNISEPVRLSATTLAMPPVQPPSGLRAEDVEWNRIHLAWNPSPEPDFWRYEVVDPDANRIVAVTGRSDTSIQLSAQAERTYRFQVRAARLNEPISQPVHSAPSNTVTVTTPAQAVEPPANVQATVDGNDITLTWERTEAGQVEYLVFDGDVLETIVLASGDTEAVTIQRAPAGERNFTVRTRFRNPTIHGFGESPPSEQATVTLPPTDDSTPPTAPTVLRVFHDCETNQDWYELEGAIDDVTDPDDLTFEAMHLLDSRTRLPFVRPDGYGVPRVGDWPAQVRSPIALRAVDEAGNRSEPVQRMVVMDLVNCD